MTRETRIGLLVGLLFIVMFALILSELTGADSTLPAVASGKSPAPGGEAPIIEEVVDSFTRRPTPPADRREPHALPGRPVDGNLAVGRDGSGHGPLAAVDDPRLAEPGHAEPVEPARAPRGDAAPREPQPLAGRDGRGAAPPAPGVDRRPPADAMVGPDRRPPARQGTAPPAVQPPRPSPRKAGTYTVQQGDSLIAIARKVYGPGHDDLYKRIFEANRNLLNDPGTVAAGQTLVIPPLPDAAPGPAMAEGGYREATRELQRDIRRMSADERGDRPADAAPLPRAGSVYKVRRGDNLFKIAREVLNDPSRSAVRRILDANKGKIRDPNRLPVGVELVIPS